jgi:ribosomal protein RSM22 (predicted rRNA methylase)
LKNNVPYQVLGTRFFERREVKDLLAYVLAAKNNKDLTSLGRIINTPTRGIGKVTYLKICEGQIEDLPSATRDKVRQFYRILDEINKKIEEVVIEYNQSKGFSYIISRQAGDFIYYKDSTFNITNDLVKGLNDRYNKEKGSKKEEEKKKDSEPEVDPILAVWAAEAAAFDALEAKFIAELGLSRKELPEIWRQAHPEQ